MRIKRKTLTIVLFALLSGAPCFGQSSFQGLTPGVSTRRDVERALGRAVRAAGETLTEYAPPQGLGKIYVEYGEGSQVVAKIEIRLLKPVTRAALAQKFKLPDEADARETGEDGKLVEYFGGSALIAFVYTGADEASGVARVGYYSRELFESAAAKAAEGPQAVGGESATQGDRTEIGASVGSIIRAIAGGAGWGPINQQAGLNGERLTFYRGTTPEQCQADCDKNPKCVAFTLIRAGAYNPGDPPMCYLMSEATSFAPSPCCVSAIKNRSGGKGAAIGAIIDPDAAEGRRQQAEKDSQRLSGQLDEPAAMTRRAEREVALSEADLRMFVGRYEFVSSPDDSFTEWAVELLGDGMLKLIMKLRDGQAFYALVPSGKSKVNVPGQGQGQSEQFNFKIKDRPGAIVRFTVSGGKVREMFFAEERGGEMTFAVAVPKP